MLVFNQQMGKPVMSISWLSLNRGGAKIHYLMRDESYLLLLAVPEERTILSLILFFLLLHVLI